MNHYDRLKVTQDAPVEVIKAAYRALAAMLHPDRQGGCGGLEDQMHDQMAELNAAYETLFDPESRAQYDALLMADAIFVESGSGEDAQDTRVEMDWAPAPVLASTQSWQPKRRVWYLGAGVALVLVAGTAWTTWEVWSHTAMEQALSSQYATRPKQQLPDGDASSTRLPERPMVQRTLPSGGYRGDQPARQPTVAELSRMSDDQLLHVLPTLGDPNESVADQSFRQQSSLVHHPLDGRPLGLRVDKGLIDPLAPEPQRP